MLPNANRKQLLNLTNQIQTFTEGTDADSSDIENIRYQMVFAEKLLFLGFAFEGQNLELISPRSHRSTFSDSPRRQLKCYGTSFQISDGDQAINNQQIVDMYYDRKVKIDIPDVKCRPFFDKFKTRLATSVYFDLT